MASPHVGHPDNVLHVYPAWQAADHDLRHGAACWCEPETEIVHPPERAAAEGILVVHREIHHA